MKSILTSLTPQGVVTDITNIVGLNAYHVVSSGGVNAATMIDGFSITGGQADGYNPDNLDNLGGGMYNYGGSIPVLNNLNFSGNLARSWGGGMYNEDGSNPGLTNVTFFGNEAGLAYRHGSGGGMFNQNSNPILKTVTFIENGAGGGGGGMFNYASNPILMNVTFFNNATSLYGGGMVNDSSNPTLLGVIFTDNGGGFGGGMYNDSSNPKLINVVFSSNTSVWRGGGMCNHTSNPFLINVTFLGNSCSGGGGGMYNNYTSSPILINTILWENGEGNQISNAENSFPVISFSDIQGSGGSGAGWDSDLGVDGGGNIDTDPFFTVSLDPGNNDPGDLHLQLGSPAIDSGTNSHCPNADLDGNPRPIGSACDMGAYEFMLIHKNMDDPFPEPGQTVTFTIVIANQIQDFTGGVISDTLPPELNFVGPITLEPPDAGLVGLQPPILASGLTISYTDQITITFPATVSYGLDLGTRLINTAAFSSTELIKPVLDSVTIAIMDQIYLPTVVR